jgi:hypothetical protein
MLHFFIFISQYQWKLDTTPKPWRRDGERLLLVLSSRIAIAPFASSAPMTAKVGSARLGNGGAGCPFGVVSTDAPISRPYPNRIILSDTRFCGVL